MELVGVMYPNLARSVFRRYFMECMLDGWDVPPECVFRFEAHDNANFDNKELVCDAAIADGFDCFARLRDSWMSKADLACQWTWLAAMRDIANRLLEDQAMLYLLDDKLIRKHWLHLKNEIVDRLDDLSILQMFQWPVEGVEGHGIENVQDYVAKNFQLSGKSEHVYHGFNNAGDSVMVFTALGAQMVIDWISEFPYDFLEIHVLRRSQVHIPGAYSLVDPWLWMGGVSERCTGSYRMGVEYPDFVRKAGVE